MYLCGGICVDKYKLPPMRGGLIGLDEQREEETLTSGPHYQFHLSFSLSTLIHSNQIHLSSWLNFCCNSCIEADAIPFFYCLLVISTDN